MTHSRRSSARIISLGLPPAPPAFSLDLRSSNTVLAEMAINVHNKFLKLSSYFQILLAIACFLQNTSASSQQRLGKVTIDGTQGEVDLKNHTSVLYNAVVKQNGLTLTTDRLQIDGTSNNGLMIATGSVQMHSTTASITADHADIEVRNSAIHTVHFTGAPVRLQQQLADARAINGHSDDLKYDLDEKFLYMTGNGNLSLQATEINAQLITYDISKGTIHADQGSKPVGQVHAIISPTTERKITIPSSESDVRPKD